MKYNCEKCHYFTKVKCNFAKHMASKKHSLDTQLRYICKCLICAKKYKSMSGLWHNKKHNLIILENSESLQISIKKEPDKLLENDRSTEQKNTSKNNNNNKPKTHKKYIIQPHSKTKRRL